MLRRHVQVLTLVGRLLCDAPMTARELQVLAFAQCKWL
jgi:hypothetical protein